MSLAVPDGQCCWMDGCGLAFTAEGCAHDAGCVHRKPPGVDPNCCRKGQVAYAPTNAVAPDGPPIGGLNPAGEMTGIHHVGWDSHAQRGTKPYADSDTTETTW